MKRTLIALTVITLALFTPLFAGTGSGSRYYNQEKDYYDFLGRNVFEGSYYRVYDMTLNVSPEGESGIYKYKDRWDRWAGVVFAKDMWLDGLDFKLELGEKIPAFYTPYTFQKASYDGVALHGKLKSISAFGRKFAENFAIDVHFTRISDPVIPDAGDWEALDMVENDLFFGANLSFGLSPVYLYVFTPEAGADGIFNVGFKLPLLHIKRLGVSLVNQYHTINTNASMDFRGSPTVRNPSEVYVRVSSYSNNEFNGKAYVYPVSGSDYVRVKETLTNNGAVGMPSVSVVENDGTAAVDADGESCYTLGPNESMVVKVLLPNDADDSYAYITNLTLEMKLAGTFVVQANTSNSFLAIAPSQGLPADAYLHERIAATNEVAAVANRGLYSFGYGERTGLMNVAFSFEVDLLRFLHVEGELAYALSHLQYPVGGHETYIRRGGGISNVLMNISGDITVPLLGNTLTIAAKGNGHIIPLSYSTTFYNNGNFYNAVDDNDDGDEYEGILDGVVGSADRGEEYELPSYIDRNDNLTPDYQEEIIRVESMHWFFYKGRDRNNNGIADHVEDDRALDYPFAIGTKGYEAGGEVAIQQDLVNAFVSFGRVYEEMLISGSTMDYTYVLLDATITPKKDVTLSLWYEYKGVRDGIADDYVTEVGEVEDTLLYRDSRVSTFFSDLSAKMNPFAFNLRLKYMKNEMLDAANTEHHSGVLGEIIWENKLSKRTALKFIYKVSQMNTWTDDSTLLVTPENTLDQTILGLFSWKVGAVFTLDFIYNLYAYYDVNDYAENYLTSSGVIQLSGAFQNKAPLFVIIGLQATDKRYDLEDSSEGRVNASTFEISARLLSRY